jgi:hypothetical protein
LNQGPEITTSQSFEEILLSQFKRYPGIQSVDLYKLIHQAALGSEHAMDSRIAARDYLLHELEQLGEHPCDPLIDPISPDGSLVRVHLRPFVHGKGDLDLLLKAFIETANTHYGDFNTIRTYLAIAQNCASLGTIPLDPVRLEAFFKEMVDLDFPAVHHSPSYVRLYAPAYRVLQISLYPALQDLH